MNPGIRIWAGIPGLDLDGETQRHLLDLRPGGVILFGRNFHHLEQFVELTEALRSLLGPRVLIAIDQEGGRVVRLTSGVTVFPGNMSLGANALSNRQRALDLAYSQGRISGRELREAGVDINLAPCVDLLRKSDERGIGSRSFGGDSQLASELASALGRGHRHEGVHDCWKHFPGIGRARLDPHHQLPTIEKEGTGAHLQPFITAAKIGASLIMTSHVVARALDADQPVTFSPKAVSGRLRSAIGFGGVIVSDCLEMGALDSTPFPEVAHRTALAGHDALLVSHSADRQLIARDAIEKLGSGHQEHFDRLEELCAPIASAKTPLAADGASVATEIAEGGVTPLAGSLLRIPPEERWLLVLPELEISSPVEDPLRGENLGELESLLECCCEVIRVAFEPTGPQIAEVARRAADADGLLLALKGGAQAELVRGACQWNRQVIFLLLEDPREMARLRPTAEAGILTAYGYRQVHQRALARVLLGEIEAAGRSPIEILP